ncbi:MAG: ATP synthase F0 subunit B [Candidatus Doudnabacteria bacterium RIFCSPHIGHO2_02_FULL_46_11]|uniref:ATP synthase subunit b n=1 Tax=Candidatus Doudnabacteria bacterium RIFCSPHIGHO2_02_FULL_46_11 TaxID=1817832 RepID=A0A1F5P8B4_9BACT|nr:MAG: ATP synthase F0 subunit B [Candidatus Doudnabacteria bacterium RIFCSPHIGHO2_02_FULL_46_11]
MVDLINIAHAAEEAATAAEAAGPIGTLGLNLKLFVAQLVNFGVVLFVLWRWVLTPVAKRLQERTDRIEKSLQNATALDAEKEKFEIWKKEEMGKVRSLASGIVAESKSQAEKVKVEVLARAKNEQEELLKRAEQQIASEKDKMLREAKEQLASLVVSSVEKVLREKIDDKTDQELIRKALN